MEFEAPGGRLEQQQLSRMQSILVDDLRDTIRSIERIKSAEQQSETAIYGGRNIPVILQSSRKLPLCLLLAPVFINNPGTPRITAPIYTLAEGIRAHDIRSHYRSRILMLI